MGEEDYAHWRGFYSPARVVVAVAERGSHDA